MRLTDTSDQRHSREQRTPRDTSQLILDIVHSPGSAPKDEQLNVVYNERYGLEESSSRSRETLQNDICQEEVGRGRQVLRKDGRNGGRIRDEVR